MKNKDNDLNLSKQIKKFIKYGLWSFELQRPDNQILQRIDKIDRDIVERLYELHLPEDNQKATLQSIIKNYELTSKNKRKDIQKIKIEKKLENNQKWEEFKNNNFVHLGKNVSNWLNQREENSNLIKKNEVPSIPNAKKLSDLLKIKIPKIKWLAYHRASSTINHYIDFNIPKTRGGYRKISKPKTDLTLVQNWIKINILEKIKIDPLVHGFTKGRSHISNAVIHQDAQLLINLDIKDFFPSINYYRVRSIFHNLGYSGEIATVFALLCTKQDAKSHKIKDKTYYFFSQERSLPQGACTSPILSNLAFIKVDNQLITRANHLGFRYTRYADDLTFSTKKPVKNISQMMYAIKKTLEIHNFTPNNKKTKILGKNNRQNVTGLVINSGKPNVPRYWRRNLRAMIHQYHQLVDEYEKQKSLTKILGSINYLRISHPQLADRLAKQTNKEN